MALSRAPESPTFYGPASGGAYRYSPGNPPRVRGGAHDELHDLAGHPAGQLGGTRGGHRAPLPAGQRVDAGATPLPADVLDRAITAARLASTAELNVNDVIEAGAAVDPAVVEAMLVETQASFALDRRTLLQLDDSGVPAEVIDLMVALSFPDEFVVERPPARTAASFGGCGGGFVDPFSPYGFDLWYPLLRVAVRVLLRVVALQLALLPRPGGLLRHRAGRVGRGLPRPCVSWARLFADRGARADDRPPRPAADGSWWNHWNSCRAERRRLGRHERIERRWAGHSRWLHSGWVFRTHRPTTRPIGRVTTCSSTRSSTPSEPRGSAPGSPPRRASPAADRRTAASADTGSGPAPAFPSAGRWWAPPCW